MKTAIESPSVIHLTKGNYGWLATFQGPCAVEIMDLFGTDTIPTAFTEKCSPERVAAEISRLNPGMNIILHE